MNALFRHRRWNGGCALLVFALVLVIGLFRSRVVYDGIIFPYHGKQHLIYSRNGAISWLAFETDSISDAVFSLPIAEADRLIADVERSRANPTFREWIMPYWIAICGISLCSTYLMIPILNQRQKEIR